MSEELDIEVDDIEADVVSNPKRKKKLSVVKYDPETDTNFHDIDMDEFRKWQENHDREYREDLEILKQLEAMCPREDSVYYGRAEKNNEQKKSHPFYSVLYGFHQAANEHYLEVYRFDSSKKRKRYEEMKAKAKQYLKTPPVFDTGNGDDISLILKEIGL